MGVDVGVVVEEESHHAHDARRPPRVGPQEAGEAGIEDRLAVERAAPSAGEGRITREAARHFAVGTRDARRGEIEALQGRIGGGEGWAKGAGAGGGHEQRRGLGSLELPYFHELLPARPARHAILAGNHELGVMERGMGDGAAPEARMMRTKALYGIGVAAANGLEERTGLLAVELERWTRRRRAAGAARDLPRARPACRC